MARRVHVKGTVEPVALPPRAEELIEELAEMTHRHARRVRERMWVAYERGRRDEMEAVLEVLDRHGLRDVAREVEARYADREGATR